MDILIKILQFILSLSILIVVHELGHFFFARLFKMRVDKFYMFFNAYGSILKCKKIKGKWKVKWFFRNDKSTRIKLDENGIEVRDKKGRMQAELIPLAELPDDNWNKYPETTEWGLGWLPFGGYCKINGMIDESMDREQLKQPVKQWEFRSQKAWKRLLMMTGGVMVNFILALAIYGAVLFTWGSTYMEMRETPMQFSETAQKLGFRNGDCIVSADGKPLGRFSENALLAALEAQTISIFRDGAEIILPMPEGGLIRLAMKDKSGLMSPYLPAIVDSIMSDAPAAALLQKSDRFLTVENNTINSFFDLKNLLNNNTKKTISAVLLRNNDTISLVIPLNEKGLIGFTPQQNIVTHKETFGFWQSIPEGINYGIKKLSFYVRQLKFLFSKDGASNLSGFGGIGNMFAPMWDWQSFWENTAFLSIILAFMNILPIPALDGGHVLFLLYEVITRRKPSDKFLIRAQTIGMVLLLSLVLFANGMDVLRAIF